MNVAEYLDQVNAIPVTAADLQRVLEENIPPNAGDSKFGELSITNVSFELPDETKAPTAGGAIVLRLLAFFALTGSEASLTWKTPAITEWRNSPVIEAAAAQPLVQRGTGFGFDSAEFESAIHRLRGAV